jgi:uncharacterized protein YbcI
MDESHPTRAQQIARAARDFERQRTGHAPESVAVVLGGDTLVITLHGTFSPEEQALARSPAGAEQLREFHRRLFMDACGPLRQEVKRITGVAVREAPAEVAPATGAVIQAFPTGTVVQVFLLAGRVPADSWAVGGPAAAE